MRWIQNVYRLYPKWIHRIELAIKKLEELSALPFSKGMDNDLAIQILNQSVMNSWQGLFPLKEQKINSTPKGGVDWSKV